MWQEGASYIEEKEIPYCGKTDIKLWFIHSGSNWETRGRLKGGRAENARKALEEQHYYLIWIFMAP